MKLHSKENKGEMLVVTTRGDAFGCQNLAIEMILNQCVNGTGVVLLLNYKNSFR